MMRGLAVLCAGLALGFGGAAQAALPYSNVIVFGDSLVDAGNAQAVSAARGLPDPTPSGAGYFDGRFSNGYNFADYISRDVTGGFTAASFRGGANFAVGASPTVLPPGRAGFDFSTQLGLFAASGRMIAADTLVIVNFGGNDVRDTRNMRGAVRFDAAEAALRGGVATLLGAGARNIVVTGLPDIGALPESRAPLSANRATPAELTARSGDLNRRFRNAVLEIDRASPANVDFYSVLGFQRRLAADPSSVGLPEPFDTTTPCIFTGGCGDNLFFDAIHPTTAAHRAIAGSILSQITAVPEPSTWAMLIGGAGMTGGALRRRRRGRLAAAA